MQKIILVVIFVTAVNLCQAQAGANNNRGAILFSMKVGYKLRFIRDSGETYSPSVDYFTIYDNGINVISPKEPINYYHDWNSKDNMFRYNQNYEIEWIKQGNNFSAKAMYSSYEEDINIHVAEDGSCTADMPVSLRSGNNMFERRRLNGTPDFLRDYWITDVTCEVDPPLS